MMGQKMRIDFSREDNLAQKNVAALHIQFVVKKMYLGNKMLSKNEEEELNRIEQGESHHKIRGQNMPDMKRTKNASKEMIQGPHRNPKEILKKP